MDKTRHLLLKDAYERYSKEIIRYLNKLLRENREEAQDIAQTAFLRLEAQADIQNIENTRAFLYRTAKNLVIDGVRRRDTRDKYAMMVRGQQPEVPQQTTTPEDVAIQRQRLRRLDGIIENLPAKRRRAFLLNRLYGLSYAEISLELNISKEGVRKHVSRALAECVAAMVGVYQENCDLQGPIQGENFCDLEGVSKRDER